MDNGDRRKARRRRVAAALLVLAGALSVFGAGSGGPSRAGAPSGGALGFTNAAIDVTFAVVAALATACAIVVVYALTPLERRRLPDPSFRQFAGRTLAFVLFIMAVVYLTALLADLGAFRPAMTLSEATRTTAGERRALGPPDWRLATLAAVATLAAFAFAAMRDRPRQASLPGPGGPLARDLAAVLESSLARLRNPNASPRSAVIAAYADLEALFTAHELPRRDSEAPGEYLRRVLQSVPVSHKSTARLADLYSMARFSSHAVTPAMRQQAEDALNSARHDLATP